MPPPLRSYEHLIRLALLFAAGVAGFVVLRAVLVPADFGLLGPYRAGALALNANRPAVHAGQVACLDCHSDVGEARTGKAHARVACESCHGPLAAHAADPAQKAVRPDARSTCAGCHTPNVARPAQFKAVHFADHAGDAACTSCHQAHAPNIS